MKDTHLMIGVTAILFLFPYVSNKWVFVPVVLIASLLPDIDTMHSYFGKHFIFRPLQWFVKHRGMLHSLTFCLGVTSIFVLFLPELSLSFFVGYGLHLFADSLTVEGIRPWWPASQVVKGSIKTNGRIEKWIFYCLILASLILLFNLIF